MRKFVQIDDATYGKLEALAEKNGYESVEKLLTDFASKFSTGCSVTLTAIRKAS